MSETQKTVFVVDDDQAVRESLEWLLTAGDLSVRTYSSATEFLNAFVPGTPGCLLVDVRMPGMSGLELQEELTARAIDIPVIVITGHSDYQMALRAIEGGASDFLEKPLDDESLMNAVRKAMSGLPAS